MQSSRFVVLSSFNNCVYVLMRVNKISNRFWYNLQLKPTEFLNLDAILEGVMHRLVVRPLRSRLYSLLASWHSADVRRLHAAIERAQHTTPLQLGVKV